MPDLFSIRTRSENSSIATDYIAGLHHLRSKVQFGDDGDASDVSTANPLPVTIIAGGPSGGLTDAQLRAAPVPVSGALTDTQLRASAVPVSAASLPLPAGAATSAKQDTLIGYIDGIEGLLAGTLNVAGAFYPATQPISGTVGVSGSVAVTGTFWQATQPVSIAATVAVSGPLTDAQIRAAPVPVSLAANQSVNNVQVNGNTVATGNGVVGTGVQRIAIASDNSALAVTAPTLTKATQGATGFSTQDLKDAGRVSFGAATVIAGVAAVSTEALLSMVPVRDGVAAAGATSIAVTSGKRLRVQSILAGVRSSAATVLSGRVALRMNPSGAVTATSPIIAICSMTQQAAALAEAGDTCPLIIPDGFEISGMQQIGLTQVCSGTGGVVYGSIVGFEY